MVAKRTLDRWFQQGLADGSINRRPNTSYLDGGLNRYYRAMYDAGYAEGQRRRNSAAA